MLWIAFLPVVIAGCVVVPAMVLGGLPLTVLLIYLDREAEMTYVSAGLGLGLFLPIAIIYCLEGDLAGAYLSLPGILAGYVTAAIWGRWRGDVANRESEPVQRTG